MKTKIFAILFFTTAIFCFNVLPARAVLTSDIAAQTQSAAGEKGANFGPARDPRLVAAKVIEVVLGLLGTVFLVYLVYAGFLILISQGEEEKVKQGKKIIIWSTLGIFVVLSAFSITLIVDRYLREALGNKPEQGPLYESGSFTIQEDMSDFYNTDPLSQDTIQSSFENTDWSQF